jgi:hypothetical protein
MANCAAKRYSKAGFLSQIIHAESKNKIDWFKLATTISKIAMNKILLMLLLLVLWSMQLPAQPVISTQPTNQFAFCGSNATFSVMAAGVGPFTYQWLFNGTNLPSTNIITTFAGKGVTTGSIGDNGPATNAVVPSPEGVTVDQTGNLFIAGSLARIRMVDTNGRIITVAGNGSSGFSGDGGPATNAQLRSITTSVSGVVSDGLGNLFISDTGNCRVRKVDTNGIITTVAGTNSPFYSGDGGPATNAGICPEGIAMDRFGNLFIADTYNNRIRKVNTNGTITTVAGTGSTSGPLGDGGAATNASLYKPEGVAIDSFGDLLIADTVNSRIRKVDTNGTITTVAGTNSAGYSGDGGSAVAARLDQPSRVIPDAFGNLFIADTFYCIVRKVDVRGVISTVAGTGWPTGFSGDGGAATNAQLNSPLDLTLDTDENLYIADNQNNRVRKVGLAGSPTLQLNNITTNILGNYQVIITSPSGSVTSSIATLTMLLPPSITSQPANITATNAGSANFLVTASGTAPLNYQWWMSSGRSASAVSVLYGLGQVVGAVVTNGGAGYSSIPQVHFVGSSMLAASGTAVVSNGMVTAIVITSQGFDYFSPPTIQIDAPSVTNAFYPDQTNATLSFSPATSANATNYFVVVTNNYGSVTSATVALTVFLPPQQFTLQNLGAGLQLQLTGTPYYPYILQSTTNLTPPVNWQSILTNPADVNGNWQFTDTNLNGLQKFYRTLGQ